MAISSKSPPCHLAHRRPGRQSDYGQVPVLCASDWPPPLIPPPASVPRQCAPDKRRCEGGHFTERYWRQAMTTFQSPSAMLCATWRGAALLCALGYHGRSPGLAHQSRQSGRSLPPGHDGCAGPARWGKSWPKPGPARHRGEQTRCRRHAGPTLWRKPNRWLHPADGAVHTHCHQRVPQTGVRLSKDLAPSPPWPWCPMCWWCRPTAPAAPCPS